MRNLKSPFDDNEGALFSIRLKSDLVAADCDVLTDSLQAGLSIIHGCTDGALGVQDLVAKGTGGPVVAESSS